MPCLLGTFEDFQPHYSTAWSADHTSSEAESWLQGVEDTENLVAELDLVLVVTLRQVLYLHLQYVKNYLLLLWFMYR